MNYLFEKLEDRCLLAGNISAVQKGSTLIITGDNDGNLVSVYGTGGNITVTGFDTTLNGSTLPLEFSGVENLKVNLKNGNNSFSIGDLGNCSLDGYLKIKTGKGNDLINTGDGHQNFLTVIGGKVSVNVGSGNDFVGIDSTTFNNSVNLKLGAGNDTIGTTGNNFFNHKKVTINGGKGTDALIEDFFNEGNVNSFVSPPKFKGVETF